MTALFKIPKWVCDLYIGYLQNVAKYPRRDIGLLDKDMSNFVYHSRRSNLMYVYLRTPVILLLNWILSEYLTFRMNYSFRGGINAKAAPIFVYDEPDSEVKAHRDRDMLCRNCSVPRYVAVLCLCDDYEGGELYINDSIYNEVSRDGRRVTEDIKRRRFHELKKGDLIVFRNNNSIHGTLPLKSGTRITTGFRSKP